VKVTVVVPARNAGATIGRTLSALAQQAGELDYEVIVVDSGSADDTAAIARAAGVRLLHNPRGEPAGSRNLGARHGDGGVLAFTDADCQPAQDWLQAGLRALADADLVQGKVLAAASPGPFDRTLEVLAEYGLYETANLFVRREAFADVGGFQPVPGLGIGGGRPFGEDAWFAWRAKRAGASSKFAGDAVLRHAVFPRGAAGWIFERWRCRHFPALVALIPELRRCFLHRRLFLSPASLRFDLALMGSCVAISRRRPVALVALAPYVRDVAADARRHGPAVGAARVAAARVAAARVAADLVTFVALLGGSLAAGSPVL
jgi:glycosyltransferase involved in cell wall biosynthesis